MIMLPDSKEDIVHDDLQQDQTPAKTCASKFDVAGEDEEE
jgi:hypothetical protein